MTSPSERLTADQRANLIDWIHALESGTYEQGRSYLGQFHHVEYDDTTGVNTPTGDITHCCWGVAAEIGVTKHQCTKLIKPSSGTILYGVLGSDELNSATPPAAIRTLYGVDDTITHNLMAWNDAPPFSPHHKDFRQIADFLRKYYDLQDA